MELSEEDRGEEAHRKGRPRLRPDDLLRLAAEDTGELPESVREQEELNEALREQAHAEHFGEDPADGASDEDMWSEYRRILGEDA